MISLLPRLGVAQRSRRKVVAGGLFGQAEITRIGRNFRNHSCVIYFSFRAAAGTRSVEGSQRTTQAAVDKLALTVGSQVQVRYLAKRPKSAFIDAITLAERMTSQTDSGSEAAAALSSPASIFYVAYAAGNSFRWIGEGDLVVADPIVRFTARQQRAFRFPKTDQRDFALTSIMDVERFGATVRLEINEPHAETRKLEFMAADAEAAEALVNLLPSTRTQDFVPILTERETFNTALLRVTPNTPITFLIIAVNVSLFLVATARGGGLFKVDPEVMIRLGTDYTPLTLAGQWWRLFTSIFLHFGLFHIALNMWALYINGRVAERIFGSLRYVTVYLVAGLSGSVVSLWWHPIVNGAGASGAIFGVLGAMLAFFLKREGGVPASVVKANLSSVGIFVAYSLLNASRYQGIDNAAHLGGLAGGLVMGLILSRPVEAGRDAKSWTFQWAGALTVVGAATILLVYLVKSGTLTPRVARDSRGNAIPLAALGLPVHSLGGFQLNMTTAEVLKERGDPISRRDSGWTYNSVDSRHDGVLTLYFPRANGPGVPRVLAIEFVGHDQTSAPPEIPYLNSLGAADVIQKYGEPVSRRSEGSLIYLWFRNGVFVVTHNDRVIRYGIVDLTRLRS